MAENMKIIKLEPAEKNVQSTAPKANNIRVSSNKVVSIKTANFDSTDKIYSNIIANCME